MDEGHEFLVALHDDGFADEGHRVELVLNLLRVDVLAVGTEEHILDAALDEDMALGSHDAEVAGVVPAFGVDGFTRGFLVLVVSEHQVGAAGDNLAGHEPGIMAEDLHFHAVDGDAHGGRHEVLMVAIGDERRTLGGAIAAGDGEADADEELFYLLVEGCTTHDDLLDVAAEGFEHLLADGLLHLLADYRHIEQQPEGIVLDLREYALADDLLDDERHGDDDAGLDVLEGLCDDGR